MKRVVHLIKATGIAGAEGHLLVLLPALAQLGYAVEAWVLTEPGRPVDDLLARFQQAGVPAQALTIRRDLDPGLIGTLRQHLKVSAPAVLHTHLIHADVHGVLGAVGLPLVRVSSRHNDDGFRRRAPMRLALRLLNQPFRRLVAISEAVRRFTIEVEGAPSAQVVTIPYGYPPLAPVDGSTIRVELGLSTDQPLAVCVARHTHQKGLDVLLTAWAQVVASVPTARLALVGDGPLRTDLTALAHRLGIAEGVSFPGWRNDALHWMAAANVVALASRWEGFGLVLLEAMAQSRPLVASAVSAIPEIVRDGDTGLLVAPDDPAALAAALTRVLTNPPLAAQLGAAGRARLETDFSVARMAQAHATLYAELGAGG